jgi:hypothetical protein
VRQFCDVDYRKINAGGYVTDARRIPVVHFSTAEGPFAVCVAKGRVGDDLSANVATKPCTEGEDLWYII